MALMSFRIEEKRGEMVVESVKPNLDDSNPYFLEFRRQRVKGFIPVARMVEAKMTSGSMTKLHWNEEPQDWASA